MKTKAVARTVVAAAIAMMMAACGGGGGDAGGAAPGSETGVFTDGPVGGVEYSTSGGHEGLTDAAGRFRYNPGETVTFSIGSTTLGRAPGAASITPIQLAEHGANMQLLVVNLLVLLQTLDADGDPTNGISISPTLRSAAAAAPALDLTAATSTLTASAAFEKLMDASGTPRTTPVTSDDALAHFSHEFFSQLRGGWVARDGDDVVVLRFQQNGAYAIGETGAPGGGGQAGIETGYISWDATTGELSSSVTLDTNGEWGLSHLSDGETARIEGDRLVVREDDGETFAFERVANDPDSIVGMWALGSATDTGRQTFVFSPAGTYMMIDPVGDEDGNCAVQRGIEVGSYTFSGSTLSVTQPPAWDQNGCAGLWDSSSGGGAQLSLQFNADKSAFTVDGTTLYRISR